ncbi:glutaredoxin domain-containing protein [Nonomuraea sp. NPDC050783]|uniref:glutaredoxin domain-containing protein n=1 Tax=Nonomuraea sp. NPDC050783 TaxID=3154634 RepID=UPI00346577F1
MTRGWMLPGLMALCGLLAAGSQAASGAPVAAVVLLLVFVLAAGWLSPLAFPRLVSAARARERSAADGRAIIYWRAGCRYCLRLRVRLGRDARRAYWVDIWRDPEGAAAVRAVAGGNETVPTVVLDGQAHVNPDPAWVRDRLRAQ